MIGAMADSIRVNFSRPLPIFALADTVLLPHAILPLHIFESHYRQMIDDVLDQSGQIAMATYAETDDAVPDGRSGALRSAVCVGQIVQHEGLPDGRHNILVHGVCRARIVRIDEPESERLYHLATLQPLESHGNDPPPMHDVRERLRKMLSGPRLKKMRSSSTVMEWFDREDIPTHALLELVGFTMVKNHTVRYRLLEEPDPFQRAEVIAGELRSIDRLVKRAMRQNATDWPKGMSWN